MVIVGHALCPAIYHYMVENSKDLNSPNRQYILIPSGFYKTRISVEVDFFNVDLRGGLICVLNSQNPPVWIIMYLCVRVVSVCTLSGFVLCFICLFNKCKKWQQTYFHCSYNSWLLQGTRCVLLYCTVLAFWY
jgi:hypothetical protein